MTTTVAGPSLPFLDGPAQPGLASRGRVARWVRGPSGDPVWARPALLGLLALTALLYLWDLGASGDANSFYAAAVQAGTKSWKAMFFGSFDSSNFITVDKPPAALWVMDISARIFGFNSWSLLVPQALEGVAAVGVLYATVKRWFGPGAGLLAGAVLACTPVAVLMFKYNNPDALLVLLLVLSAYAMQRAVEKGQTRWLVLAGALVGFGFITKMLQAFLVVPAFALAYLIAGPTPLRKRILQLLAGGLALVVAAGWWVAVVQLTPAADRPYVGGSQDNSLLNLIFGYNGFGRLTGNETGSVGGGGGGGTGQWGPTGLTRLFNSSFGSQASWLIPAALVLGVAGLWMTRRTVRTDARRAAFIIWGGWLVVTGLVLSLSKGIIHPYYTVALAPAIGALVGMGAAIVWRHRAQRFISWWLSAAVALSAVWAYELLGRDASWHSWLRPLVLVCGLVGAALLAAWPIMRRSLAVLALSLALIGGLGAPLAYALNTSTTPHSGAIPSAGPAGAGAAPGGFGGRGGPGAQFGFRAGRGAAAGGTGGFGTPGGAAGFGGGAPAGGATTGPAGRFGGFGAAGAGGRAAGGAGGLLSGSSPSKALVAELESGSKHYKWIAATVGANSAAGYQIGTGQAVMAIGGFNGTDPAPSLSEFEADVAAGDIHWFIGGGGGGGGGGFGFGAGRGTTQVSSEISSWVQSHFTATTVGGVTLYNLTAPASSTAS